MANSYITKVISAKRLTPIKINDERVKPIIDLSKKWASKYLNEIKQSGSTAKNTAIKGNTDFDVFISLHSDLDMPLKDIYNSLDEYLKASKLKYRRQNVSFGIYYNNLKIDVVPAKRQAGTQNWHTLYSNKTGNWLQTNIEEHISKVINSGRINEIVATKIWRENHKLVFPSIFLELSAIKALKYKRSENTADNFLTLLNYLSTDFVDTTIIDPANTNNIISDTLYKYEKQEIAKTAKECLNKKYWKDIIW